MIKFIPKLIDIESPLSDPEGFTANLANKSLASQLNKKLEGKFCPDHPTFENRILVHFKKDGNIMTVQSYCCQNFKEKLDLIAQNKNPFSSKTTDE
ncbi:MAG: hypothetical protein WDN26_19700 [Chitinophagaceae bacterium]